MSTADASDALSPAWSMTSRRAWMHRGRRKIYCQCRHEEKKVSPIYTIGASYSFLTFLTRLMSWKTMNKIIGAIYAK